MIPLALVIARRGNAGALRMATAPRPRPTVYSATALAAVAFFSFVLGALIGAGLVHASLGAGTGSLMHNTRVERLADTREDEKDNAAPPHFDTDPETARARRDIDRWMNGGEPFRDGELA